MIKLFSIVLTVSGAMVIAFSIYMLYSTLKLFKGYTQKVRGRSSNFINCACIVMMVFFLLGYIIYAYFLFLEIQTSTIEFFVAVIFFLGSIFVYCMVLMQNKMFLIISQRSRETIFSLISAVEAKDIYTKGHSEHVREIVAIFYTYLPQKYKIAIDIDMLLDAAMLHDIGKIGIPDFILNKDGSLTKDEYEIIKQHPKRGYDILKNTAYKEIANWVLYHHERVDGKGYYAIKNEDMPIEAKVIAIADAFSALYTNRVYRRRFSYDKAIEILKSVSGTQLDQELVDIFCSIDRDKLEYDDNDDEVDPTYVEC